MATLFVLLPLSFYSAFQVWWKIIEAESPSSRKLFRKLMGTTELSSDAEVIIKLQRAFTGWMGFGIDPKDASVNGMQNTDMYIAWIDSDASITLMDAWSIGFMPPQSDSDQGGENNILEYAGEEKDGTTTVIFKRKVDTGDAFDRSFKEVEQDIVFAFGEDDGLPPGGHGPCCRGKTTIHWLGTTEAPSKASSVWIPSPKLKNAHAWMMTMAWALFAILGLTVSQIGRHWKHWQIIHISLEITAVVFTILGELLAFVYTQAILQTLLQRKMRFRENCVKLMVLCLLSFFLLCFLKSFLEYMPDK